MDRAGVDGDLNEYRCFVDEGGYRWVDARPSSILARGAKSTGRVLIAEQGDSIRSYDPSTAAHSALFRVFAETPITEEGILAFANRYGRLGGSAQEQVDLLEDGSRIWAEPLEIWHEQIAFMRSGVAMWDIVRKGDTAALAKHVGWKGDVIAIFDTDKLAAESGQYPDDLGQDYGIDMRFSMKDAPFLQRGSLTQPAMLYLQFVVNPYLRGEATPTLRWNEDWSRLEMRVATHSLLGALWLQFLMAIDGGKDYYRCKACRAWFVVDPDEARADKAFCSNACRSRAYRGRIAEARRLHAEGILVGEIAERLDSDPKTVTGWIERSQERRGQRQEG